MDTLFNIVICDDDADFADEIRNRVNNVAERIGAQCEIIELYDGNELTEHCRQNITDIVLADIDMPGMNGFDAVNSLREQQPELAVIFITAHEELAFQAYSYQPFWFVSKRDLSSLEDVLLKLFRKIGYRKSSHELVYIQAERLTAINTEQVIYLKSSGHYLTPYTMTGSEASFRCGIQQAYAELKDYGYICAHRCYIVNCRYIERFNKSCILLKNNEELPISRSKEITDEAFALYKRFLRRSRW